MPRLTDILIPTLAMMIGVAGLVIEFRGAARTGRPLRVRSMIWCVLAVAAGLLGTVAPVGLLLQHRQAPHRPQSA